MGAHIANLILTSDGMEDFPKNKKNVNVLQIDPVLIILQEIYNV